MLMAKASATKKLVVAVRRSSGKPQASPKTSTGSAVTKKRAGKPKPNPHFECKPLIAAVAA